ncbi:hypothetical protein [Francisella frigiditurris]|uniref:Excinuclease ATPase subunit domain protein n=1 Tax=Francisella frigiditurris TaxID=1542390 RepID=A0A1J0KV19_9GAMM|nr:hypothetical protein [Francisella frigiditurris]APC97539.1 excinuclease ATPase subunit domain protein [Francisella frigiditurris]
MSFTSLDFEVITHTLVSPRSNSTFRDVTKSCNMAFYSDLIKLSKQARDLVRIVVANIQSNWKHNVTSSTETYVCADGLIMSGVALRADIVK